MTTPLLDFLLPLFAGAWLAVALWATLRGWRRAAAGAAVLAAHDRLAALVEASPALPLVIDEAGALTASDSLAGMLGLEALPEGVDALLGGEGPLVAEDAAALAARLAEAAAGTPFTLIARLARGGRAWRIDGGPAPAGFGARSVLLWFTDVTEAEDRIANLSGRLQRRSDALEALSRLIEAAPFPMWHRGPDHSLTMVNGAYVAAVEAEDAASVVRQGIELADEPLVPAAEGDGAAARKGLDRIVPATIAGERRMMRVVEVPLGPGGAAGYAIDVEDRERARAELTRFARAQRDMLDRLSAGVAQFGRDRALAFYNQPFARMFALPSDFLADHPEFDRLIDEMRARGELPEVRDFPEWKEQRRQWFTSGLVAEEEDWLLSGARHLRVVAQPLPDGGLLLIFEDRTEQIQLASARDTLLRVRSATFDNLFEAVAVFASDGRLSLWNSRFRDLWGFDDETLDAHPRVDALTPHLAARLRRASHAGLVHELVRTATQQRQQRSGRVVLADEREFEFAAVPLPDGNALFTMLDISDSRKVEAALRERTEALEEADRLKTAFVSNMSYELRTPLTSIGGFAEMLAGGYAGELSATARDYVAAILDSVARLSALIDNVLDLTQSDTGSLLLAEDEVDVAALCEEVAAGQRDAAARKGLDLAVEPHGSAGVVTGDTRRLAQAIGNLLANAIAYTDEGGRVLLRGEGTRKEARIIVSDNGRGIAPADQQRVFDRFHRTTEQHGEDSAAVGLGLPLARQFVEAHGGTIALHSEPGKGTTVTVTLPRTREQQAAYSVRRQA